MNPKSLTRLHRQQARLQNGSVKLTAASLETVQRTIGPAPVYGAKEIMALRKRMNVSQPVFAAVLNVSPETVKKWEQGTRAPDGASLRLLELADLHPSLVLGTLVRSDQSTASNKIFRERKGFSK